jgi:hypothetical protein
MSNMIIITIVSHRAFQREQRRVYTLNSKCGTCDPDLAARGTLVLPAAIWLAWFDHLSNVVLKSNVYLHSLSATCEPLTWSVGCADEFKNHA